MKKIITAICCTTMMFCPKMPTVYAAEMLDRDYIEPESWEDMWHGKGDDGTTFPEASYKHHLLDQWLNDNYGSDEYDWTELGELKYEYKRYYQDKIEDWDFNDDNSGVINGKTFQTLCNQGKVSERAWKRLLGITDEACREYGLSVIEHPEKHKGKSHWEWQMNREGLSWKAKLKFAIDSVVEQSESWEDFLRRCAENRILVQYNPEHKIGLKFMLAEQREHNPRAKFTRSRTLGWFYETAQIKSRIAMNKGILTYTPPSKIKAITTESVTNKFIQDAITRGNMKIASIAKNILTQYGVSHENMHLAAMQAYAQRGKLSAELNRLQTEIEDSKAVLKVLKRYHKVKGIHAELKNLSGRKEKKFREQNSYELQEYKEVSHQLLEWFPDKHLPKVDELEQKISALMQERNDRHELYKQASQKSKDLAKAQQTIEEYLKQERNQPQKRKNNGELE